MNAGRYLVGAPVYRAASNAPTRGTVDPMGYINRSLGMSPVGGDGFSDKRSGLAQMALQRLQMGGATPGSSPLHGGGVFRNPGRQGPLPGFPPARTMQPVTPGYPPQPQPLGHIVSSTGQLLPASGTPYQDTIQAMNGAIPQPDGGQVSEQQLMEAARNRLNHQIQTKEMLTKHQINMLNMHNQAQQKLVFTRPIVGRA